MKKNIGICKVAVHAVQIGVLVLGLVALVGCGSGGSSTSSKITMVTKSSNANVDVKLTNRTNNAIEFCLTQSGTQFRYSLGTVNANASKRISITLDSGKLHLLNYVLAGSGTKACYGITYGRFTAKDKQSYTYEIRQQFETSWQWNGG